MKRLTVLSAALALATAAGLAQAQVSSDDYSVLTGPNAPQMAVTAKVARPVAAQVLSNVDLEQGLVGPQAAQQIPSAAPTITRAQVVRERDQARAQGAFQPGADYLNVVGAPTTQQVAGSVAVPAGQ